LRRENVFATDIHGVIYEGRKEDMDPRRARYAQKTDMRTLGDVIDGADVFLGLSAPGVLKPEMVKRMADRPLIMALANPVPEIMPDEARKARPDAIIATGRSDFPNQVNNVLCFPFIFRGALDVGATEINEKMKIACVHALADLARVEASDVVATAYGGQEMNFGPDYLIPRPFDPRLVLAVAPAVAKAAMDSGAATRPIKDFDAYKEQLSTFICLPLGLPDEIGLQRGAQRPEARGLCRGRGRARIAGRAGRGGRGAGEADSDRAAARCGNAHQSSRAAAEGR
jgi:malate dehydrogenase (oxaloacetate-decarboxylating)(NADP+)